MATGRYRVTMANRKEARVHKEGDYVLATRWPSGDVDDAWAIGVYNGSTESSCSLFPVVHHVLYSLSTRLEYILLIINMRQNEILKDDQ